MDLKDIKVIIDLMKKNSLSEFELEKEGFKIKLKRGGAGSVAAFVPEIAPPLPAPLPAAAAPPGGAGASPAPAPVTPVEELIKSPMIGTFYRAPAPEAAAYVEIGAEVGPDTVVCIIEAMKVMNEIKAETRGVLTEIVAENGKPVEFGQPLFKIRPA
ncbi:MAG: acetyl-CoA carboxylase biotin carboxyl carrier protein [Verrucomicrobiales bacterium]|nr:acetyl-CoA carboxylase biotin carboxyl carrier protein [Verrucomicrobiales bacterium]MCP5525784.1 acetyl-CoA carboxylase biotin carboxyl carrier protein [Verrucomicrobiales bacterium]